MTREDVPTHLQHLHTCTKARAGIYPIFGEEDLLAEKLKQASRAYACDQHCYSYLSFAKTIPACVNLSQAKHSCDGPMSLPLR